MTKDDALKIRQILDNPDLSNNERMWEVSLLVDEALEQPAQEPVAWMHRHAGEIMEFNDFQSCQYCEPLYTHPAPSWQGLSDDEISHLKYLHVDYELFDEGEYGTECNVYVDEFARAIEQALKEKNT